MFCSRSEKKASVEHDINMINTCNLLRSIHGQHFHPTAATHFAQIFTWRFALCVCLPPPRRYFSGAVVHVEIWILSSKDWECFHPFHVMCLPHCRFPALLFHLPFCFRTLYARLLTIELSMNVLRWVSIAPEINERAPLTLCKLEPASIIRVSETPTIIPVSLASDDERLPNNTVLDREQNRSSVRSWKDRYTAALGLVDCWPCSRLLHAYLYDFSSSLAVVCFTRVVFTRLLFPSSLFKIAATSGFLKLSGTSCFIFASPSDSFIYAFQSSSSHGSQRTSSLSSSARKFCLIPCSSLSAWISRSLSFFPSEPAYLLARYI